jgi:hypothetical protein
MPLERGMAREIRALAVAEVREEIINRSDESVSERSLGYCKR